jgi:hypothetical protein
MKKVFVSLVVILMLFSFNTGYSKCEQPAIPPHIPAADCLSIWCGMSYSGCGAGNGEVCNTSKACQGTINQL